MSRPPPAPLSARSASAAAAAAAGSAPDRNGSSTGLITTNNFQRCVPCHVESLRLLEMSVANLKTLYTTRATLLKGGGDAAAAGASSAAANRAAEKQLHSVTAMINHLVSFMSISLEQLAIEPTERWQRPQHSHERIHGDRKEPDEQVEEKDPHDDDSDELPRPTFLAVPTPKHATRSRTPSISLPSASGSALPSPSGTPYASPKAGATTAPLMQLPHVSDGAPDFALANSTLSHSLVVIEGLMDLEKAVVRELRVEDDETKFAQQQRQQQQEVATSVRCDRLEVPKRPTGSGNITRSSSLGALSISLPAASSAVAPSSVPHSPLLASAHSNHLWHLQQTRDYFRRLLSTSASPYGRTMEVFVRRTEDTRLYRWVRVRNDAAREWRASHADEYDRTELRHHLRRAMRVYVDATVSSLRTFVSCHFRLVLATYPFLTHTHAVKKVALAVLTEGAQDELAPTLRAYFAELYRHEDAWMARHIAAYIERHTRDDATLAVPLADFGLLDVQWASAAARSARFVFSRTLRQLEDLFTASCARVKAAHLANVCRCLSDEYSAAMRPDPDPVNPRPAEKPRSPSPQLADLLVDARNPVLATLSHFTPFSAFQISRSPSAVHSPVAGPSPAPPVPPPVVLLSSDELLPLLAYCLVHLPPSCQARLYSDLQWIESSLDETATIGEQGFALASLCSAVQIAAEVVEAKPSATTQASNA